MTGTHYERVLPRDLFNEADLLKCLGRLFLLIDDAPKDCELVHRYPDRPFIVSQDESDGSITCVNISMIMHDYMTKNIHASHQFWRPLNTRNAWTLYIETNEDTMRVFDDEGNLSEEFKQYINFGRKDDDGV